MLIQNHIADIPEAHYPYEFYEVMLQHYSDKGNKDKVALIKQEMLKAFETYRELYIRDVRLSYKDLVTLIQNMINKYTWDHSV